MMGMIILEWATDVRPNPVVFTVTVVVTMIVICMLERAGSEIDTAGVNAESNKAGRTFKKRGENLTKESNHANAEQNADYTMRI